MGGGEVTRPRRSGDGVRVLGSTSPAQVNWGVGVSVDNDRAGVKSGCAPGLCPALNRAAVRDRDYQKSWQYVDNGWHGPARSIKVDQHPTFTFLG